MAHGPDIVAHLIVGSRPEPYLAAVLDSIEGVCAHAVVNDNSGTMPGPNDEILHGSRFARDDRLTIDRSAFTGFADARNACIDATPARFAGAWTLFVDADEVHGDELPRMGSLLSALPSDVDAVDGYSRHFVGSFAWWLSVERRLCFFRARDDRRWSGRIHEHLDPIGRRAVLPCVWSHYGHVVTPRMEWEKSRLYSSLGQAGFAPTDAELSVVDAAMAWGRMRPDVMRYRGEHPPAARPLIRELATRWAATFADVDALFARCSTVERLRRTLRRANYSRMIALRGIEAGARWGWTA